MFQYHLQDTIVALATPAGTGAIAVIRLSGTDAIALCKPIFKGKDLEKQKSHTLHYGNIIDENGDTLDEVLVAVFKAPHSYTKQNSIEISCHGSPYIIQKIIALLIRQGARLAQPGEFTMRAFLNGQMDLSQAEAVADLIASQAEAAHKVALQQMRGGIGSEIKKLREQLIHFASLIELELDFAEEDVNFANRDDLKQLVLKIKETIHSLLQSFALGNAIKNGVNTVIAGRPNAGKSTLLNALLQEERAIVSPIPGTTRDTIEEILNINGVQFRLIDTAGIREATDAIEALGIAKTLEKIRQSAVLIYVFDVIYTTPQEVYEDLKNLHTLDLNIILVPNKMDLNPYTKPEDFVNELVPRTQIVPTSAQNNMNVEYLKEKIYETAIQNNLSNQNVILNNARHYEALSKANNSLDAVLAGMEAGVTSDFIAMDIRHATQYLGEVTGEIGSDDLLEKIFSSFCIGK